MFALTRTRSRHETNRILSFHVLQLVQPNNVELTDGSIVRIILHLLQVVRSDDGEDTR